MHDWTLIDLRFEWATGTLIGRFKAPDERVCEVLAEGVQRLTVPRRHPWGRSISVNNVDESAVGQSRLLRIEMQSGDMIEIEAARFILPS